MMLGVLAACASTSGSAGARGAASPPDAARRYMIASLQDDVRTQNALTARERQDCPASSAATSLIAWPIKDSHEHTVIAAIPTGRHWTVRIRSTDGDESTMGTDVTVVRYEGRYWVC